MYIIAGLGNPGLKYKNTRHNVGFFAIDSLASKLGVRFKKKHFSGITAEAKMGGEKVLLLKPLTYMNLSGDCVAEAVAYYKLPTDHLIVIYDDIDLELGRLRIRASGSAGSHNGMRSIIGRIRTYEFPRVRVGIGAPPPYLDLKDYVIGKLSKKEKLQLEEAAARAADAAAEIVQRGIGSAQQKYNTK